ncbi:aldo/keto reductase [Amycolatopsis roodepoortensis]|uniref:Aryl-alcohol dehydrogenase-like predicted oxidoreductase n=1 Tax=Amycolatopsis roodepoortensis TaxID=700274 RepID=A0ABR9LAW1_9PSEU|nr:aldo/keto reductase [Amycolatopsis roodepoortensis]MBE1577435.1 aryl-alcohol dehydrogenase-like predicted oxidoreductase [Amycolatopsis roodepoortensis]
MTIPQRRIGRDGPLTGVLSLGSWHTYDRMDFREAVDLVRTAVDSGITLFDVGVYGFPGAAPVFTDVLFSAMVRAAGLRREDYLFSAKLWLEGYPEHDLRGQLDNALFRAGVDHADLVVLGDLRNDDTDLHRLVLDLNELREAGLIRQWGVNNWSATTIRALHDFAAAENVPGPAIAQLKYSVARRSIPDGEPFGKVFGELGVTLQSSDIFEGGILLGKNSGARQVGRDPGDIRERIAASAPELAKIAAGLDATPAQLCLAFTLTHPANTTTLFGATSTRQLEDNLGAVDLVERVGAEQLRELVEPYWADRGVVDPEGP